MLKNLFSSAVLMIFIFSIGIQSASASRANRDTVCPTDMFHLSVFDAGTSANLKLQDTSPYFNTGGLLFPSPPSVPVLGTQPNFDWTTYNVDYTNEGNAMIFNSGSFVAQYLKPENITFTSHSRINTVRDGTMIHSYNRDRINYDKPEIYPIVPVDIDQNEGCAQPVVTFNSPALFTDPDTDIYFKQWFYHDVLSNSGNTYYTSTPWKYEGQFYPPALYPTIPLGSNMRPGYPPLIGSMNLLLEAQVNNQNGGLGLGTENFSTTLTAILANGYNIGENTQSAMNLTGLGKVWRDKFWRDTASDMNTGLVGQKKFDGEFYFTQNPANWGNGNKISNTFSKTTYQTRPVIYFEGIDSAVGSVFGTGTLEHTVFPGSYTGTIKTTMVNSIDTAFVDSLVDVKILVDTNGNEASIASGAILHSNLDNFNNPIAIDTANIRYTILTNTGILLENGSTNYFTQTDTVVGKYLTEADFRVAIGNLTAGEYKIQYDYFATDSQITDFSTIDNYRASGNYPQNAIFSEPISRQIIIKPTYKIEYYLQNSDGTSYPITATESQTLSGTTNASVDAGTRTFTGYTYEGGNTNNTQTGTVLANGSLVLKRYYEINKYTLFFEENGGTTITDQTNIPYNTSASETHTTPTRDGYTFGGWYKDSGLTNQFNFVNDKITQDTTVYAKWIPAYKAIFIGNGGSDTPTQTGIALSGTVSNPNNPVRNGYTFGGWYTDSAFTHPYSFSSQVNQDVTLYAKWTKNTPSGGTGGGGGYSPTPVSPTKPISPTPTTPSTPQPEEPKKPTKKPTWKFTDPKQPKKNGYFPAPTDTLFKKYPTELPQTGVKTDWSKGAQRAGVARSHNVVTNLPHRSYFKLAGSTNPNLKHWLSSVDAGERNENMYIVLPTQGLVMPVNVVPEKSKEAQKFLNGANQNFWKYLAHGAIELPGTSTSNYGEVGNKVISGHSSFFKNSSTKYKTHFQRIIEMDAGQQIWIYQKQKNGQYKRFVYKVEKSYNTSKYDIGVLKPTKGKILTLFTCTPIGGISGRWIVRARYLEE